MMRHRFAAATFFVVLLALVLPACGGDDNPTAPSGGGGGGGGGGTGGTVGATITITASGVSPQNVTVAPGSRVTFVNNDTRPHDMSSDPHPEHTNCTEITVGFLAAGQSGTTQNLNRVRTCPFHDHNQPDVTSLQGTIRIQ
jgi:plastocyanin